MDLAQLVDFEVQLHRDEESLRAGAEADLRARDARIGERIARELGAQPADVRARLESEPALRAQWATAWLRLVAAEGSRDGERTARALRRAALLVTLVLLLIGAGSARSALAYDGKEPVNVFVFLGVLVLPQIALLLLLLWAMACGGRGLLGSTIGALAQLPFLRGKGAATLGAVGARLALHAPSERWFIFALAQRGAVAFNVGALAACLLLVSLTDLAFGWSTTLQLAADQVHSACRAIAAPWGWIAADAVPSPALVRDSQWVRMPGSFVSGRSLPEAVASSGRWWSFLVAALTTWGLLPRVLAWSYAAWRSRQAPRAVAFDDPRCRALFARLLPAPQNWQGPAPDAISLPASERAAGRGTAAPPGAVLPGATWLLCWGRMANAGDALLRRVTQATGSPPLGVLAVGGADVNADTEAVRRLGEAAARRVLLAFAAGSQPTKDALDLLQKLRVRLGPRAHLGVTLISDAPGFAVANDELAGWRACIDRQADPYLALERLETTA